MGYLIRVRDPAELLRVLGELGIDVEEPAAGRGS